jgi:hypothetical protein
MGKNSKRRREEKKKKHSGTPLDKHQRIGKMLVTPFNNIPAMQKTRWSFDRMPELLWACLVRAVLPRESALIAFRRVVIAHREMLVDAGLTPEQAIPTHANLANHYPQLIPRIVEIVVARPLGYAALRILLLFEALPARDVWAKAINAEPQDDDADVLADAIAQFLWHQSEPATDVRWLTLMCAIFSGKMHFPDDPETSEMLEELRLFPDKGDMRSVRPTIRSMEISLWVMGHHTLDWSQAFWRECLEKTPCLAAAPDDPKPPNPLPAEFGPIVWRAINLVSDHWINSTKTTDIDAKHEGAFGFVLYALRCLLELVGPARIRIAGRLLLRTIVECRITLAYLVAKNDASLWIRYRHYGSGQAKLALLKISEAVRPPHSVTAEQLDQLANEDVWDEFVDINLGNWAGADLRKMADESGTKDVYDAFYGWNSGFSHGQWAAVRDSALTTCLNPLHRLHRIPLAGRREFGDVVPDAIGLVEGMVDDLSKLYPGVSVDFRTPVPPPESASAADTANPEVPQT